MDFLTSTLTLGIIMIIILSDDKQCCNAFDELAYSFRYSIESPDGTVVSQHWEERRADLIHGSYSFLEPTGKIRVVEYQVSGNLGFRAVVKFRDPPDFSLEGHLKYPDYYKGPIFLAEPVSFITNDLFKTGEIYPNLPG